MVGLELHVQVGLEYLVVIKWVESDVAGTAGAKELVRLGSVAIGDVDASFKEPKIRTMTQNFEDGIIADGRSGILRITQDGKAVGEGILGNSIPLKHYYAYGIRNSFGLGFDPWE